MLYPDLRCAVHIRGGEKTTIRRREEGAMKADSAVARVFNVVHGSFVDGWGVRIAEGPMQAATARAVWVIDKEGIIRYQQLVPELGHEPEYDAALAAAAKLLCSVRRAGVQAGL